MLWSAKFCFMKWMMCGVVSIFVEPYNRFFGSILLPEKPNIGDPLLDIRVRVGAIIHKLLTL